MNIKETVLSITKDICYISEACAKSLMQLHSSDSSKVVSDEDYGSIICEFDYLFLHIIDRYAHMLCTEDVSHTFMETLGLYVINTRIASCTNVADKAMEEMRNNEIDSLNKRNVEYANYNKLYPDDGQETRNTLFWEFGKKITTDYLHSANPAEIVFCAHLGSDIVKKVKIDKLLKEMGREPRK